MLEKQKSLPTVGKNFRAGRRWPATKTEIFSLLGLKILVREKKKKNFFKSTATKTEIFSLLGLKILVREKKKNFFFFKSILPTDINLKNLFYRPILCRKNKNLHYRQSPFGAKNFGPGKKNNFFFKSVLPTDINLKNLFYRPILCRKNKNLHYRHLLGLKILVREKKKIFFFFKSVLPTDINLKNLFYRPILCRKNKNLHYRQSVKNFRAGLRPATKSEIFSFLGLKILIQEKKKKNFFFLNLLLALKILVRKKKKIFFFSKSVLPTDINLKNLFYRSILCRKNKNLHYRQSVKNFRAGLRPATKTEIFSLLALKFWSGKKKIFFFKSVLPTDINLKNLFYRPILCRKNKNLHYRQSVKNFRAGRWPATKTEILAFWAKNFGPEKKNNFFFF
ncbi:hypothetical protein PUN28_020335 [Cardiocondyla obscurior]|uniref:Uncharacterized protein n=1 Tax=Cardiocondyla obscurior TaxID=286306 RepID=A0AAW2E802_9HYME